ncbi:MAG: hypothetical protein V1716_04245 [Candidatus Uhrbacteria bacterium]
MGKQLTKQDLFEVINKSNQELHEVINSSSQDILEAINDSFSEFEGKIVTKFNSIDQKFNSIEQRLNSIDRRFDSIEQRMATKADLAAMETRLVTKSYLDDKLSTLRGDLLEVIQKEDHKLGSLVNKLANHKVLPVKEVREILAMEPFAKTL